MAWILVLLAGLFEIVWAMGLKYAQGFTRLVPTLITFFSMGISVYLLSLAAKTLPIGTAYAAWTGIGAVGAVTMGIILFNEPVSVARIFFLMLIVAGIVGLNITSGQ